MLKFIEKDYLLNVSEGIRGITLLQEQTIDLSYLLKNIPIWFKFYNNMLWDNKLKTPLFEVKKLKNIGGLFYPETKTILISNFYDKTEDGYKETLIHEMIHLYIDQFDIHDRADHGSKFKSEMFRVNSKLPSTIQIDIKSKVGDLYTNKQSKRFGVLMDKDSSGIGITVFDVKIFRNNYDHIKKIAMKHLVKPNSEVTLGISNHPKLLSFKVKRSLKSIESYDLSKDNYNDIIKDLEDKETL